MNIYQVADKLNLTIVIRYQSNIFTCAFENSQVENGYGSKARNNFGQGETLEKAIKDYTERIKGKLLTIEYQIFNDFETITRTRKTFIPEKIDI